MRGGWTIGLLALALAGTADAQMRGSRPDGPPHGGRHGGGGFGGSGGSDGADRRSGPDGPRVKLFISPAGEPFHGEDGLGVWFARADTDKDGTLSRAEFRADAESFFAVLDADKNQVLDPFELQDYERRRVPEISAMGFGGPGGGEPPRASRGAGFIGREGAARFSLLNEPQPVAGADLDLNGRVTLAEWTRTANRRFDVLDKAQTGKLARETLPPLPGHPEPGRKPRKD